MPDEFISEDDLDTFEGFLRFQAIDPSTTSLDQLAQFRIVFEEAAQRRAASPKMGLMKLPPQVPGEHRYAVAVRDGDLWLALWVRCSHKGEFFVFPPRPEKGWNPHMSYHLDGRLHAKSHDHKKAVHQRQPLTGAPFRGREHLGVMLGYGPKSVGAICNPADFTGVVEVAPGVLGPRHGAVAVELLEPGQPLGVSRLSQVDTLQVFRETCPWVVIAVGSIG